MNDQQLNIFHDSGREPLAGESETPVTPAAEDTAACPTEPASRPEPSRRTQMKGPLPGTTFEDAFGGYT